MQLCGAGCLGGTASATFRPDPTYVHRPCHQVVCRCSASGSSSTTEANAQFSPLRTFPLLPPPDVAGNAPQRRWNAVCLAYLGDGVWEAALRHRSYDPANAKQYNTTVARMANTQAQAACYQLLIDEGWVTTEEAALMRWATNSSSVAPPPHATRQQYKQATAVETLVAHLYLTDSERLQQLLDWLLHPTRVNKWRQPVPVRRHQPTKRKQHSSGTRTASSDKAT